MISTYGSAILICAASIILGRAVCVLSGREGNSWLAAPVGFAVLMVICEVAVSLPGHGWTAVGVLVVLCGIAVWITAPRAAGWPSLADLLPVAVIVLLITTIPFAANGRVGILGVNLLNDTHWHLYLAQGLLDPSIRKYDTYGPGYPLGPHAVSAVFAQLLGTSVDKTLNGVLIATPVLTGLAALGLLGDLSRWRRWLVAILAAIPYLAAAAYIQSAFKEPIMALLLVGMVVALQAGHRERFTRPAAVAVPIGVLIAGMLYDYSYPGLVWPVAMLACWAVIEAAATGAWRRLPAVARGRLPAVGGGRPAVARGLRSIIPGLAVGIIVLIVLVAPDLHRIYVFWTSSGGSAVGTVGGVTSTSLANLASRLSALEGFNLWFWGDFRFVPPNQLHAGVLAGFAAVVLVFAIVRAIERRELAWLGGMAGLALVFAYSQRYQSPYVAAKALTVPAPLLMVGCGAALLREFDLSAWRSAATVAVGAAALVFFAGAFYAESLVLRDAPVDPVNHFNELRSLRRYLHHRPTLVLFQDDYFKWELLGVPVSSPLYPSPIPASVSPAKPWTYGQPLDFDSVDAATLNRFDYVITTRTPAQSQPPANFHLVATSRSYEVWKRVGQTRPFSVLPESGYASALLNCRKPADRHISQEPGIAAVRPAPTYVHVPSMVPGNSTRLVLHLAPGRWNLSMPYVSPQAISVRGAGLAAWLPPNLDRPGSIWPVGDVVSTGAPLTITLTVANPDLISNGKPLSQFFAPEPILATPLVPERTVPLKAACGHYVDWYRLS